MKLVWAILAVILLVSAIILPMVYDAYVKGEAEDTFFSALPSVVIQLQKQSFLSTKLRDTQICSS